MIGYYNYTVITTYVGLVFGILGITNALSGNLRAALICLMAAGFCDMMDGTIACKCKDRTDEAKAFGIQIDSLCDLVCFGVLPSMICFKYSVFEAVGRGRIVGLVAMTIYILSQVIRLGYFNVQEAMRQQKTSERRKSYTGLPVTSAALIVPVVLFVVHMVNEKITGTAADIVLILLSVLFVSRIPVRKPGNLGKVLMTVIGLGTVFGLIRLW